MYQRRSVAAMLQRELDDRDSDVADPLFIPLTTVNDKKEFFLQPGSMEVRLERPMMPRGGILCEDQGAN